MTNDQNPEDARKHLQSMLMRESLVDRDLQARTDTPIVRMLPDSHVVKIGGRSIMDVGRSAVYPVVEELGRVMRTNKLIISTGGGARTRHVFSIGLDLGLPTGALAQFAMVDALGTAHMLGTLLAPLGVVAIPPEMFGHLLPLFLHSAPGVIFCGSPPYSMWEHPPAIGRIPPHRTDAGTLLVAECFGSKTITLVKNVGGVFTKDPHKESGAELIREVGARELIKLNLQTLPFDRVVLEILSTARLVKRLQVVNGLVPGHIEAAVNGEHVGTFVHAEA